MVVNLNEQLETLTTSVKKYNESMSKYDDNDVADISCTVQIKPETTKIVLEIGNESSMLFQLVDVITKRLDGANSILNQLDDIMSSHQKDKTKNG